MSYCVSEEDKKWQRRDDARTLARAQEIKADKERMKGAVLGAREIASEEIARVQGIAKIAGMRTPSVPKSVNGTIPNKTQPFNRASYKNPATIGRLQNSVL